MGRLPGPHHPHTISRLSELLSTCTHERDLEIIRQLPAGWAATNDRGYTIPKRQQEMPQCGAYKDDHNVLTFQQTILSAREHANTDTQFDTLLAQSIAVDQNDVWTRQITNPLTKERPRHPLQTNITIMQIYHSQHYTTFITDKKRYYHYDGLGMPVPHTVTHLHNHIR